MILDKAMGRRANARRPIVHIGLLAMVALAGCASMGGPRKPPPPTQRDLLTREEILESTAHQGDLLNAVQSLRPTFLATPRGVFAGSSSASARLAVYVDRIRQTGVEALRSITASKVADVRYLDPTASLNEFGPTASGGAILVRMYDPDRPPSGSSLELSPANERQRR